MSKQLNFDIAPISEKPTEAGKYLTYNPAGELEFRIFMNGKWPGVTKPVSWLRPASLPVQDIEAIKSRAWLWWRDNVKEPVEAIDTINAYVAGASQSPTTQVTTQGEDSKTAFKKAMDYANKYCNGDDLLRNKLYHAYREELNQLAGGQSAGVWVKASNNKPDEKLGRVFAKYRGAKITLKYVFNQWTFGTTNTGLTTSDWNDIEWLDESLQPGTTEHTELANLREWKRQQTIVMDQLNLPAIGKELEVPLGETIPDKVLPAIKALKKLS